MEKKDEIKNNKDLYITKDLLIFSKIYMEKFLELISKSIINFQKNAICFIIDCSLYLGFKAKLFNLLLILSIMKTLYIVDIQFSIILSADDKYKVIIKNYDDNFNYEDLIEILYETVILKRFRNNILKTLKTAIEYLKHKQRNTIYISFFDCMDESFTHINYWLDNILIEKSNSFLLIIEKSRLYKEENKEIIDNMINSFNKKVQKHIASKIKIKSIALNFFNIYKEDIDTEINSVFSDLVHFLSDINESNIPQKLNKKNKSKINYLSDKKIEYFEEIIKDNTYSKFNKILFINERKPKSNFKIIDLLKKKRKY